MSDFSLAVGGQNYRHARYLTHFAVHMYLANTEDNQPGTRELIETGANIVAGSFIQGTRCVVDKTIIETFMKHGKSHGTAVGRWAGLTGLGNNYEAYHIWVKTTPSQQFCNVDASFSMPCLPN